MNKIIELKSNTDYRKKNVSILVKSKIETYPDIELKVKRTTNKMVFVKENYLFIKRVKMSEIKEITIQE